MNDKRSNKANELAAINRRKQRKAAQQHDDYISEQLSADVVAKNTFGSSRLNTAKEIRGKGRQGH